MPRPRGSLSFVLLVAFGASVSALALGSPTASAGPGGPDDRRGQAESSANEHHDVSKRLRDVPSKPWNNQRWVREHPSISPAGATKPRPDGALQGQAAATSATATAGVGFSGIGQGDYGYAVDAAPPDTTGAVGGTQYVQWVNESFAVFDKTTGAIAPRFPKYGNTLWQGFGGGCETNNDGDPIVAYDKTAHRWVLTQFSVTNPATNGYLQCVAVSQTDDATGFYNRYAFSYGKTAFNDYPKLGVWPDGYYVSYNIFNNGSTFAGSRVCALDRVKMLAGAAATQECFQLSPAYGGLLPTDLDGSVQPAAGAPNVFAAFNTNSLDLWKFHADFTTPSLATFTGPTNVAVAAFSEACGGGTCIPQPGTTQKLDSLADRLMYRLAYRSVGGHESWVVTHSVTAGTSVGVRWYELRGSPSGALSVYQQGTYAPDSNYRWMGSAAMDQSGNIAVGYSVAGPGMAPSIAYATRAPGDALGQLGPETVALAGGGSQLTGLSRWGDYSTMTVDPMDDCTFWYSTEYLKSNGTFNWNTWITSFKLAGCAPTPQPPGMPGNLTAVPGDGAVTLNWTAPPSGTSPVTSYEILRDGAALASTANTTYTDTTVVNDTTYAYSVRAVSNDGAGPYAGPASATPTKVRAPSAPLGLQATPGKQSVALTWTVPSDLGNPALTGYSVYRALSPSTTPVLVASPAGTSYTDTGLGNGASYTYWVAGHNANGDGARSAPASATTPQVPGTPVLNANPATSPARGVVLTWTAPASNGSPISSYTLYRSTASGRESAYATSTCTATACQLNDTGARSGRRYYYQLTATNAVGTSARSLEASATGR